MEFRLLGPFEVWHDGQRVDVGAGQQLQVLVTLLLQANRPVGQGRLAEIIWPNPGDRKPKNIITYVSRLNKAFKDAGVPDVKITAEATGYVLRALPEQIDYVNFTELGERARAALSAGDPASARALLHEAVEAYRGEFLADQHLDRDDLKTRETLADAHLDLLGDLAELKLADGDHRWVRDRLQATVRANPLRQRLAAILMEALLMDDDPQRAVAVYHRTKDALDSEHGMQTSTRLKDLLWRAQYGEARVSLPSRPTAFVGRTAELDAITTAAWRATNAPAPAEVIWISGMPGVGKTATAVHAAHTMAKRFPDGQLYIDLHGFTPDVASTGPGEALDELLRILGVPPDGIPATVEGKRARYRAWLHGTRTLVVLDNAKSERQVEDLLPVSPGCLAVVTSRHVGGGLAGTRIHLDPLPTTDAVRLFSKIAGRDRVAAQWRLVEEIVRRCGEVPLQIRIVATQFVRHPTWPLEHLAELLRQYSPLLLEGDGSDAGESGAAACAVSYRHLTGDQQRLFRLFGRSPCPELDAHSAAALATTSVPSARQLLDYLHRVSLLVEVSPERYQMPDLLRAYAASLTTGGDPGGPDDLDDRRAALVALLDYYRSQVAAAVATAFPFDRDRQPATTAVEARGPHFAGYDDALNWLSTEYPNLVAAIRYAARQGQVTYTWQLAVLLWRYFYVTGRLQDWAQCLELALDALAAEPAETSGTARVLLYLAGARWCLGEPEAALDLATRALPLWTSLGDVRGEADTLCAMALPAKALGRYEQASNYLQDALTRYERIGDLRGQGQALDNVGVLDGWLHRFASAEARHLRAYALLEQVDHRPGQLHSLLNLGAVREKLGRLDQAMDDFQSALKLATSLGDRSAEAIALNSIGNVYRRRGTPERAVDYHDRALAIANEVADVNLRTDAHNDLGETCRARGAHAEAQESHCVAAELARATGNTRQLARAEHGIARALHATGRHDRAAAHWQAAAAGYGSLGLPEAGEVVRERDSYGCPCAVPTPG